MRKFHWISWFFLGATACHEAPPAPPAMGDEPTLAILGPDGVTCGAVAVTPSLAVTANHCVAEGEVTYVTASHDGRADRTGFGVVVAREVNSDLAVFAGSGFVPATIEQGNVEFEHATTLVTHVPAPWSVAKRHPMDTRDGFVQTERLESGMSGSGLWDDAGRLVGIAVGNDASQGYFAGRGRILALLHAAPVNAPLKQPEPSAALWGDPSLSLETLIASAKQHRERIEAGLNRIERGGE
ncbi:MAG TPA: serine protease [Polyangiaceae bacterium]|nr:serine protease [Polyangiaceae bacterium]